MVALPTVLAGSVIAAVASACLAAGWIALARRRRLFDLPGARRLHADPTPRGGGIGIAAVMVAVFLAQEPLAVAAGIALFALAGLLDDLFSLAAAPKLALQLAAAALMVLPFAPAWPMAVVLVPAVAYLVNAVNFMDGSNGLVALQGLVLGIALATWPGQPEAMASASAWLAAACLGFLPFNLPRARTFLGDVGSHAIGAWLAVLLLAGLLGQVVPLPAALLMLTPILLDTGLTLAGRAVAGKRVWRAHREHLYQYAVRSGHSHLSVALAYTGWTAACVLMALAGVSLRSSLVMWALVILNWTVGAAAYAWLRRHWLRTRRQGVA